MFHHLKYRLFAVNASFERRHFTVTLCLQTASWREGDTAHQRVEVCNAFNPSYEYNLFFTHEAKGADRPDECNMVLSWVSFMSMGSDLRTLHHKSACFTLASFKG
jgi:hypothetical protein